MRGLEPRLDAIAARLAAHEAATSPVREFLGDLSTEELRALESISSRLAEQGLQLALKPTDSLTSQDIAAMTPAERATAYRSLVRRGDFS